jgi:hypothetical protein
MIATPMKTPSRRRRFDSSIGRTAAAPGTFLGSCCIFRCARIFVRLEGRCGFRAAARIVADSRVPFSLKGAVMEGRLLIFATRTLARLDQPSRVRGLCPRVLAT